jgi:hypothetical protein
MPVAASTLASTVFDLRQQQPGATVVGRIDL